LTEKKQGRHDFFLLFALVVGSSWVVPSTLVVVAVGVAVGVAAVVVVVGTACFLGLEEGSEVNPIIKIAKRATFGAIDCNFLRFHLVLCKSIFLSLHWVLVLARKVESQARKEPSRNLTFLSRLATNGSGAFQDATQNPVLIFFPFGLQENPKN